MLPTVNLYIDRMNSVEPTRVADVYASTEDRSAIYAQAAAKIGLTRHDYLEFREALLEGNAIFVRLPRRIDAMAGVHRRNGQVYALRNVVVPTGTMGWEVNLADGTTVIIPQICSNLSMNRPRHIAQTTPARIIPPGHTRRQPKRVAAASFVQPLPVAVVETPVSFTAPPALGVPLGSGSNIGYGAPAPAAPNVIGAGQHIGVPFVGLLAPVIAAFHGGNSSSTANTPSAPPCSAGSNTLGICRP